ncbi:MAG TPA: deoxyribose-phosphate aldolase [Chitinophagaceae bacterium]|nr:deoxyribose-phosphate aldolase [Chitinophagaceae bacterium]
MHLFSTPVTIDTCGVEERVARFQSRSVKQQSKVQGLKMALSMIDLTTLEGKDTAGKVRQLCYKAAHLHDAMSGLPTVAAVCVYPNHVKTARQCLGSSGIRIASVATAFPSGNSSLKIKLADTRLAVDQGADEVDMVINRGAFLEGNYALVFEEIARVKETCGEARLKVILETGELSTLDLVRKASEIAILAGADFIKTSTGKIQPAATLPVTYVMLQTIQDYYSATGKMIGMKPAGGISTAKTALHYLVMLYETLGANWMNAHYFRFGASSLANDILMQLEKENTGHYAGNDYFSKD